MIFINNIFRFCEIIFSKLHFFEWDEHLYYKQQLYLCLGLKKKKLFGCPPPPAPNFWKLEKSFYCTKVYRP